MPHGSPARVWVRCEDGAERRDVRQLENYTPPFDLDGTLIGEASFALPTDLPPGYHRLLLCSDADGNPWEADAALIITPAWLGLPERLGRTGCGVWRPSSTACAPRHPGAPVT